MYNFSKEDVVYLLKILAAIYEISDGEDEEEARNKIKEIYDRLYLQVFNAPVCNYDELLHNLSVEGVEEVLGEISKNH